jgi:hypothetical protein
MSAEQTSPCEVCNLPKGVSYRFCGRGMDGAGSDDTIRCYLRGYELQKVRAEKLKQRLEASVERNRIALRVQYDIETACARLRAVLSGREPAPPSTTGDAPLPGGDRQC